MPIPKQTFAVLNTSGHTISGQGVTLQPGLNEGVSVAAFTKAFLGADGEPTPSAAKHLNPRGDKPPALLPVTVRTVPKLPQENALQAVASAQPEDGRTLEALLEMEDRKPVADAIRARLRALAAPRRQLRAQPQEPSSPPPSTNPSAGTHSGREALTMDYGQSFAAEASIEPVATPEEVQAMLVPISQDAERSEPKGILFTGSSESMPEVMNLAGGPRSFQGGPGISATGAEAPASEIQQALSDYGATSAAEGGETQPSAPNPMAAVSPESPPTAAPGLPAPKESPAVTTPQPSPSGRRGRRGQG